MSAAASSGSSAFTPGQLATSGLIAGLAAALVNLIVYVIASGPLNIALNIPQPPAMTEIGPLPLPAVIIASVLPGLLAALVLGGLARFTAQPTRVFVIVSVVVLLLSFAPVLGMPDVEGGVRVVLGLMHIIAAGVIVGVLLNRVRG